MRNRGENNVRLFDKNNDLSERGAIQIDEYFEEMELTNEEKNGRKKFAESMEEVMLFIFALFSVMKEYGYQNNDFITRQLQRRYSETILKFMELDGYFEEYIKKFSKDTIDITIKHENENYYTSEDRAMLISENESHFAFSHKEFSDAIKSGKTKKQWMDVRDNRERKTHRAVGRMILPINEPFLVGKSKMMHPKDAETYGADAEEIVNCRCSARYF